ncbi:MAG: MFS transporter, partial [Alphaproteobacteria bacterium]
GYDTSFFVLTITVENFCSGLGAAIFVAYISSMCKLHFTATQYALLSSLASAGRTWLSTPAGWLSQTMGWQFFFFFSALLAIPGLLFLWVLRHDIKQQRTVTQ